MARPLHLTALRLLAAIDELGGLGAAARAMGMAQPNASRTIASFERELGADLIERGPRGSAPTPLGRSVLAAAAPLFDAVDAFHHDIGLLTADESAPLRVSASMTVAEHLMPGWLATYRGRHPGADVGLRVRNSERVFDEVVAGTCDIGFVETPLARKDLHGTVVADDHLVIVVSPDHPWAKRGRHAADHEPGPGGRDHGPVTAEELAATPLALREPGSGTRAFYDRALAPWHPVPPAVELGSNAAVAATVRAGGEPGVLSELAVADALSRGDLVAVDVDPRLDLSRSIRAVWRGTGGPGRVARELIDIAAS
ncbi:LysR substrate-binding domain-containing protein [Corynebacterium hansenii]|uniref:LysR substrate-binding domain-containing protein n=1 Tax=Corynebacterium hansenii TaxID=394964 RepID=A0ABV7ZN44_9CORY|nr:LysR substrate-binding domain-containing protein [Corynebacterium hansenii]WJZ00176.1 HTH-type transcriptional activator CmpR [Corynebacterium hansenii]